MDIVDIYAVNAIIQILKERMKEIYFTIKKKTRIHLSPWWMLFRSYINIYRF